MFKYVKIVHILLFMFYIISTVHQLSLSIQFEQNTLSWIQFACAVSHIMGRNDPSHFQTDMICYFARSSEWIMACVLFIGEKVAWRNLTQPAWSFKNACFPMKSCLSCSASVGPLELNLQFVFLVILVFHVSSLALQSVIPAAVPSSMARSNIWQWMAIRDIKKQRSKKQVEKMIVVQVLNDFRTSYCTCACLKTFHERVQTSGAMRANGSRFLFTLPLPLYSPAGNLPWSLLLLASLLLPAMSLPGLKLLALTQRLILLLSSRNTKPASTLASVAFPRRIRISCDAEQWFWILRI